MSAPVDVLALWDSEIASAEALSISDAYQAERLPKLREARAKVAALMSKAQFLDDGLDEEYVGCASRVLLLKAALAACGGAK